MPERNAAGDSSCTISSLKPFIDSDRWIRMLVKDGTNIKLQFKGCLQESDF